MCLVAIAAMARAELFHDEDAQPALNIDIIKKVRRSGAQWQSGVNKKFVGKTVGDVKKMLGLKVCIIIFSCFNYNIFM